jgi:hypothetical protein
MSYAEEVKGKMAELEEERSEIELRLSLYEKAGGENSHNWLVRTATKKAKNKLEANRLAQKTLQLDFKKYEDEALKTYAEIPELVRQAGMTAESISRYGKKREDVLNYNKNIKKKQEEAQKEVDKAQDAYDKAEREYNNAAEDNAEAAIHAAKVSQMRIDMNRFNEQEAAKNEKNANRIQAARDKVNSMEYKALKDEEDRLLAEAAKVGDRTPEGKRLKEQADVYTKERRSRDTEARKARERVTYGGRDATGAQAQVIRLAGKVTEKAVRTGEVDFKAAADVLEKAFATKGNADNAVAIEMYKVLQNLITAVQTETAEVKLLEKNYKRLAAKAAKN